MPENEEVDTETQVDQDAPGGLNDVNWNEFFGVEPLHAATQEAAPIEDEAERLENEQLAKEISEAQRLREQANQELAKLAEMRRQTELDNALRSWETQASPEELVLKPFMASAQSLSELAARAAEVRSAARNIAEKSANQIERVKADAVREYQEKFGMPVSPNFTPPPRQAIVDEALSKGDVDAAAKALVEGMF